MEVTFDQLKNYVNPDDMEMARKANKHPVDFFIAEDIKDLFEQVYGFIGIKLDITNRKFVFRAFSRREVLIIMRRVHEIIDWFYRSFYKELFPWEQSAMEYLSKSREELDNVSMRLLPIFRAIEEYYE